MKSTYPHIILFDGHCNLCNHTVQFITKRDPKSKFNFAALQSPIGQEILQRLKLPTQVFETFVLINNKRYSTKSTAALHVLKQLGGPCSLFYVFIIVPKPIRDYLYMVLAKRRYRWFGKRDTCMVPTPDIHQRFLGQQKKNTAITNILYDTF